TNCLASSNAYIAPTNSKEQASDWPPSIELSKSTAAGSGRKAKSITALPSASLSITAKLIASRRLVIRVCSRRGGARRGRRQPGGRPGKLFRWTLRFHQKGAVPLRVAARQLG